MRLDTPPLSYKRLHEPVHMGGAYQQIHVGAVPLGTVHLRAECVPFDVQNIYAVGVGDALKVGVRQHNTCFERR